ncbi:unnamed protein product [Ambrosiozyma monospora]|uniref:Unnamed protein product n=1 Tax=Ambrosiozyma monospora TaxID=43982 RepID=A0A9W7DG91_AMBMO|nr:unnamed protein product [Ambrosiozyma monospora]
MSSNPTPTPSEPPIKVNIPSSHPPLVSKPVQNQQPIKIKTSGNNINNNKPTANMSSLPVVKQPGTSTVTQAIALKKKEETSSTLASAAIKPVQIPVIPKIGVESQAKTGIKPTPVSVSVPNSASKMNGIVKKEGPSTPHAVPPHPAMNNNNKPHPPSAVSHQQVSYQQPQLMSKSQSLKSTVTLNMDVKTQLSKQSPPPGTSHQMNRTRSVPLYIKPQPHPIAIKPKPIAIAPSPIAHGSHHSHSHGHGQNQIKSVGLTRNLSTVSNQGSEEITLTTSKNWVLPPRPKVKKNSSSSKSKHASSSNNHHQQQQQHTSKIHQNGSSIKDSSAAAHDFSIPKNSTTPGTIKVNSQIHSNINLHTNNQLDLKLQLQNVSKENDNLKKILVKLRKELENLSLIKERNDKKNGIIPNNNNTTAKNGKLSQRSNVKIARKPSISRNKVHSPTSMVSSPLNPSNGISPADTSLLSETNTIDPINLSYHLEAKRPKTNKAAAAASAPSKLTTTSPLNLHRRITPSTALGISAIGGGASTNYLSPKDIMIHPMPIPVNLRPKEVKMSKNTAKARKIAKLKQTQTQKKEENQFQACGNCKMNTVCKCLNTPSPSSDSSPVKKTTGARSKLKSKQTSMKSKKAKEVSIKIEPEKMRSLNTAPKEEPEYPPSILSPPPAPMFNVEDPIPITNGTELASEWFAKNPILDFDMYNEDMTDVISDFNVHSEQRQLHLQQGQGSTNKGTSTVSGNNNDSGAINNANGGSSGLGSGNVDSLLLENADLNFGTGSLVDSMVGVGGGNADMGDVAGVVNGGSATVTTSPKFAFKFDDNDDFMMY